MNVWSFRGSGLTEFRSVNNVLILSVERRYYVGEKAHFRESDEQSWPSQIEASRRLRLPRTFFKS